MIHKTSTTERQPLKEGLFFILKVALWLAIGYSFTETSAFYRNNPIFGQLAYGVNVFLTGSILISIARISLISLYKRRNKKHNRVRGNYVLGINQFATILNVLFGVIGLMLIFGINPKDFLTSITIVAMAIALLFRDYITNMISGLFLMFSDQFTIGDTIRMGEHQGKIVDITLANIVVRNEDDDIVLIPNNSAFTTNIINQSLQNSTKLTMDFELPLAHAGSHTDLEKHLVTVIQRHQEIIVEGSFQLKVVGVNKDAVHYKLQIITHSKDAIRRRQIRNDIFREVIRYDAEQRPEH
ncbi:mechanosensitive ion channel family protein [Parapedobacter lycopersici]|uniref:mechanosensitive ion channel family protein n=1 Tax=Parapedobacter lycopersici TaxID=1864939 RepID=UPI00214DEBB3|nr:mechanosensitive ion channel family protein [Parapedobacter lycopersici]